MFVSFAHQLSVFVTSFKCAARLKIIFITSLCIRLNFPENFFHRLSVYSVLGPILWEDKIYPFYKQKITGYFLSNLIYFSLYLN